MKRFPLFAALAPLLLALPGEPAPAAPGKTATIITSPVAAAKTLQVTQTVYRVKGRERLGPLIGPLNLAETMTFQVTRPYKFRTVRTRALTRTVCVSDGKTITYTSGGKTRKVLRACGSRLRR